MIQLYMWDACPFCKKVMLAAQNFGLQEGKEFSIIDAAPGTPGREKVQSIGGKAMVPFLVDGDIAMYESDDIIAYLQIKVRQT